MPFWDSLSRVGSRGPGLGNLVLGYFGIGSLVGDLIVCTRKIVAFALRSQVSPWVPFRICSVVLARGAPTPLT